MRKATLTSFESALLDASLEEFNDIPSEDEIEVEFSPEFQIKAQELIRKSEKRHWSSGKTALRRAALVAVIAGALLLTACSIPSVRETIIEFFFENAGTHYEFTYDSEMAKGAPNIIEKVYLPTYIPDGYEKTNGGCSISGVVGFWTNADQETIYYMQYTIPEDPTVGEGGIDAEGNQAQWISLNGCPVLFIQDTDWIGYVWTSSEYHFELQCSNALGEQELKKIYFSIQHDEDAVIEGA